MHNGTDKSEIQKIWELLATVKDPEVPVLSVVDLGIIRSVDIEKKEGDKTTLHIHITPTYSGCPAMDVISIQIRMTLLEAGYKNIEIKQVLSPAWTTDWMSASGKEKLRAFGIAPPQYKVGAINQSTLFAEEKSIICPHCGSAHTQQISEFGATACKALYKCLDCFEPFDYFKCH